jgi:hypothetical protein
VSRIRRALEARNRRRRYNCQDQNAPAWEDRAEEAVGLLTAAAVAPSDGEQLKVADLGAGNQRLRSILERELDVPCDYSPYDIQPQATNVQRLDVEHALPDGPFDVVFCLGLLEYLRDLDGFVRHLRPICGYAVISYVVTDAPDSLDPPARRERGWLTDLKRSDVEGLFRRHGYTRMGFAPTNEARTGLWLWSTSGDAAVSST